MNRTFRDVAMLQNNILAAIRSAGEGGTPLKNVLESVSGNTPPKGSDYMLATNLRKQGLIECVKNLPGGGYTAYARAGATPLPVKTKHARRHKTPAKAGILLTIQYGNKESITLSFDDARAIYGQLAAMFGG